MLYYYLSGKLPLSTKKTTLLPRELVLTIFCTIRRFNKQTNKSYSNKQEGTWYMTSQHCLQTSRQLEINKNWRTRHFKSTWLINFTPLHDECRLVVNAK